MAKATELSETEAIKQVIADGVAMDYIDVVDAVERRFQLKTSSAKVEQVHREMANAIAEATPIPEPKMKIALASKLPSQDKQRQAPSDTPPASDVAEMTTDQMALTLQFVKSIGGLNSAKRALAELEATLLG